MLDIKVGPCDTTSAEIRESYSKQPGTRNCEASFDKSERFEKRADTQQRIRLHHIKSAAKPSIEAAMRGDEGGKSAARDGDDQMQSSLVTT